MVAEGDIPSVTGISPAEGPPGTIVKIRGENLGISAKDVLGVFICNVNCTYTAEWQHSRLIHCRTGVGMGMGDIIVFTKSGGKGTCLVKFRGYMPRVGLLTEAAVWVDESKLFEEKPTTLSNSHAYTASNVHTDPLGVAPEETGAVLSADKMEEWYPGFSSNPLSENFHPSRFLLERHLDTSFEALKSGYYHLQSKDTRTSVGPSSFVRGNLATILEALQTLVEVQRVMVADNRASAGGHICAELQGVVGSCDVASNSLFKDILARKDEADAKRNVLNILHRFRFLFNLQRSIERNIQQGEYEILISDYNRAKALFQNTQVKSFQKALAEVDKKVAAFSLQLKHKLFDFPTPLEEQKKIIRYLNDLDYPGNAGLECINKQALWIKSMLLDCQLEHQNPENQANRPQSDVQISRSSEGSLKSHSRSGSDGTVFSRNSKTQLPESLRRLQSISMHNTPHSILMVEELCELISRHVSDFWNLGQTYLSNQLGDKRATVEKSGKLEKEKFQETVKDVILVFCEMVHSVLLPDNTAKTKLVSLIPWLPSTVQAVKSTLDRLKKLGLTSDIIAPLNNLTSALISECIRKILSIAIQDINELFNQEFWDLDFSEESYCLSKLPGMFEKIFIETLQFVHEFMVDTKAEGENNVLHKEVSALLKRMFEGYILSLEKTVYPDVNNSNEMLNVVPDGTDSKKGVSKDMQYLVVLSNCEHSKKLMLPRIVSFCVKYGHVEIEQLNGEIMLAVEKLDERVFSTYIELKSEILAGAIEEGIFVSEFCYSGLQPVTGIRHYIQDIVMKLVAIHYEVSTVSSTFVSRIFSSLIEKVCTEVSRVLVGVQKFSEYGSVLANLELNAIKAAFGTYINLSARKSLEKAIACIPSIDGGKKSDIDSLLTKFKTSMHYQLSIFENPDESTGPDTFVAANIRTSSIGARSRGASCGERSLANAKHKKVLISRTSPLVTNEVEAENTGKSLLPSVKTELKSISSTIELENPSATSEEYPMPSESRQSTGRTSSLSKKTKRQAPAPPPTLAGSNRNVISKSSVMDSTNPFADDSGNPFLSSGASYKEGSTNPFFGDD